MPPTSGGMPVDRKVSTIVCGITLGVSLSLSSMTVTSFAASGARAKTSTASGRRFGQSAFREHSLFRGKVSSGSALGEKLLLKGDYDSAGNAFRSVLNRNSKDTAALCGLGFVLGLQFKLDGADDCFNKALKVNANDPLAHVGKAYVSINRLQSSNMSIIGKRSAILTQAEAECRRALKIDPDMAEAHTVLGLVQKEQGRPQEAMNSFSKAVKLDPEYGMAYTQRGLLEAQNQDWASATQDLQQAISLRSSNSTAHYGMGKVYLGQKQYDEALKELNTALSLNRNSAPIHIAMGDVYRAQGNTVAAVKEYQAAIAIKSENEQAYVNIADIREGRGDLEMAMAELRSGLELNPGSTDLHRRVGDMALRLEKLDDAIKEYNTSLSLSPGDVQAVKGLTRAYYLKTAKEANGAFFVSNNFEDAEKAIQQAIKLNPNDMELRLADAKLRALSGRPVDLSTIGQPTNDAERLSYAEALLAQQRFDEAAQQMNTVIADCNDAKQTFAVADMALLIRDLDSADAAYKKAATMPDSADRAKRGLSAVANARDNARKSLTLGDDLARKKQTASAIDQFRQAAYLNPRLADAHLGLADALKRLYDNDPSSLREAAQHYRSYISLSQGMPDKEKEKFEKHAQKCIEKAYKIEQKKRANG